MSLSDACRCYYVRHVHRPFSHPYILPVSPFGPPLRYPPSLGVPAPTSVVSASPPSALLVFPLFTILGLGTSDPVSVLSPLGCPAPPCHNIPMPLPPLPFPRRRPLPLFRGISRLSFPVPNPRAALEMRCILGCTAWVSRGQKGECRS